MTAPTTPAQAYKLAREAWTWSDQHEQAAALESLAQQVEALTHEVDATQLAFEHWRDECVTLTAERDALKAEIEVLTAERDIYLQGCDLRQEALTSMAEDRDKWQASAQAVREEADRMAVERDAPRSIIDSTSCAVCWEDLPDGTALFTRPTPPAADELLTGKLELMTAERDKLQLELGDLRALRAARPAPTPSDHVVGVNKLVGERAALIEKLRWAAKVGGDSILHVGGADTCQQAADMLAADALQSAQFTEAVDANARLLVRMEGLKRVQKVVVAQSLPRIHVTEAMHRAAVKVLHRAHGLDGLPQRMLNAMLAAAPQPPHGACDSPELCKLNGECAGQYGTKQKCTAAPTPPRAERRPMTAKQISDTYKKATGQHLRPCDKHAVETLTREIEAHHKIGVKP